MSRIEFCGSTKMLARKWKSLINQSLEDNKTIYHNLALEIWKKPELMYEEHFAHDLLSTFLADRGFVVHRAFGGIATSFRAEFQLDFPSTTVCTVAILCEYDALPEIGHGCGHNLIAEAGVAAACAVQSAMKAFPENSDWKNVKLVVLGCPAEESGGGKIDLIKAGAFADVDFAMMVHPFSHDVLNTITLGIERCKVEFLGRASHASVAPWEGVNALDAAVAAYNNISMLRQSMKPDWRVHGIIKEGGSATNVIPDHAASEYYLRCQKVEDLPLLKRRVSDCLESVSGLTGCQVQIVWDPKPYLPLDSNHVMTKIFGDYAEPEGLTYGPDPGLHGSSDIGNVSQLLPSIHPRFFIGEEILIHTREFQKLAGTSEAQPYVLRVAKVMALTCLELFCNFDLRQAAKQEFNSRKLAQ